MIVAQHNQEIDSQRYDSTETPQDWLAIITGKAIVAGNCWGGGAACELLSPDSGVLTPDYTAVCMTHYTAAARR